MLVGPSSMRHDSCNLLECVALQGLWLVVANLSGVSTLALQKSGLKIVVLKDTKFTPQVWHALFCKCGDMSWTLAQNDIWEAQSLTWTGY